MDEALWVTEKAVLKAKSEWKEAFASNLLKTHLLDYKASAGAGVDSTRQILADNVGFDSANLVQIAQGLVSCTFQNGTINTYSLSF